MEQQTQPNSIAVLLLAFGGPGSLEEVEPFLQNIFCGRSVPAALAAEVAERYRAIGGRSPLLDITWRQARSLEAALRQLGRNAPVCVGMRHWHPSIPEGLKAVEASGCSTVLTCILSPFSSPAAVGGYEQAVQDWLTRSRSSLKVIPVRGWHEGERYHAALGQSVSAGLEWFPMPQRLSVPVVFTAHSLPLDQTARDPYQEEMQATVAAVSRRLALPVALLAFQSRGRGPEQWLGPNVEQVTEGLAAGGAKDILIVPAGFVADHLEVLYDLDIVLCTRLAAMGIQYHRAPVLNDSALFIEALADAVQEAWPEP